MNQAEIEKWISDQGGSGRVQYSRSTQPIPNPAKKLTLPDGTDNPDYDPTAPATIQVNEEKWQAVDAEGKPTGAVLHVRRRTDGDFDILDQANANPAKATGEPTPEQRNAAELQRQRERNAALPADQDPAYETDAERRKRAQDRIDQQGREADAARQRARQDEADARAREQANRGTTTLKPDGKGGTIAVQIMPDGTVKTTPLPGVPSDKPQPERVTIAGQVYERDPQTGQYSPAKGLPTEGQATAGGPRLPDIIHSAAAQTLTDYWNALNADPNVTPAQRQARFQEAVQVAQISVQQAATEQRERESARNIAYNVASNTLQYQQTGLQNALSFAEKLNGMLPIGSDLGGQAFAALLGLQMLQMAGSGINNLPSAADMTTPRGVEAARSVVTPAIQAAASPVPVPAQPSVPPTAPAEPTAVRPGAPPPVVSAPSAPKPSVPAPSPYGPGIDSPALNPPPTPGEPDGPPLQPGPVLDTGTGTDPNLGQPGDPGYRPPSLGKPDDGQPGMSVPPVPAMPVPVPYPSTRDPNSMLPAQSDYAVLSNVSRPDQQPSMIPVSQPGQDYAMLASQPTYADLHGQALAQVPWQMSEEQYNRYKAAGVPESVIWSTPPVGVMV